MTGTGTIQDRPGALMPINKEVLKKKKKNPQNKTPTLMGICQRDK